MFSPCLLERPYGEIPLNPREPLCVLRLVPYVLIISFIRFRNQKGKVCSFCLLSKDCFDYLRSFVISFEFEKKKISFLWGEKITGICIGIAFNL